MANQSGADAFGDITQPRLSIHLQDFSSAEHGSPGHSPGPSKLGTPASVGTVIGDSQRRSRFQTQEIAAHEAQVPTLDDELAIICKPYTALDAPGPPAGRADDLTIFLPTQ